MWWGPGSELDRGYRMYVARASRLHVHVVIETEVPHCSRLAASWHPPSRALTPRQLRSLGMEETTTTPSDTADPVLPTVAGAGIADSAPERELSTHITDGTST